VVVTFADSSQNFDSEKFRNSGLSAKIRIFGNQFSIRQLATGAMNIPRTGLQRMLYTPGLSRLAQTALQHSLRRPPSILRLAIRNASTTAAQEQTAQPVVQPAKAEQVYLHYSRR
jgi:hypothetical protein